MKHTKLFNEFMRDVVNLNQTRIDTLESRVESIKSFLCDSDFGANIDRFSAQGSWAHKTIIKPPQSNGEFDADLVTFVDEVEDWEPKDYVNDLYRVFRASNRYRDKVTRGSRCITIDYSGDFHLDVVPCIQRSGVFSTTFHVTNRNSNEKEETAPEVYTTWLEEQNRTTGTNMLRKVIRLAKYQRDIKTTFSVKSILLTTLLGMQVRDLDSLFDSGQFDDLPTALKTLTGRLDDWLQDRPGIPTVLNPVLETEDFNRHWNQEKYANFRSMIHKYRGWVDDAYTEADHNESLRKWRGVFGDEFAKSEITKAAASADRALVEFADGDKHDLVERVKAGLTRLTRIPIWPHAHKPSWRMASRQIPIRVMASVHEARFGSFAHDLNNGQPLPKGRHLRFEAISSSGLPESFEVRWRVVNSGQEAVNADAMRGGFEKSQEPRTRWEHTGYRGVHWVEAFVINKRTNECVGKSDRFFVVVE